MTSGPRARLAVVVLTHNEERNLGACLSSVTGWTDRVIVVDSGSTDGTIAIAREAGARVLEHAFESHARQWHWALAELARDETMPLWVLGLDADQRVTPELRAAIGAALAGEGDGHALPDGFHVNRRQIFRGRWIRHGGYYPKHLLKLFRRDRVTVDPAELVDHHFAVAGRTAILEGDLVEDNRNEADIAVWIAKHNRYAVRQALQEHRESIAGDGARPARLGGDPDARVRWRKRRWRQLPLFVRPGLYFVYRYILRLGFLDGREGFVFHFMQAFWYRLLVDINLDQLRRGVPPEALAPDAAAIAAIKDAVRG